MYYDFLEMHRVSASSVLIHAFPASFLSSSRTSSLLPSFLPATNYILTETLICTVPSFSWLFRNRSVQEDVNFFQISGVRYGEFDKNIKCE